MTHHPTNTDPVSREARLPQWAQQELTLLRRQLNDTQNALDTARLATDPEHTDTLADPLTTHDGSDLIGLPRGSLIRFRTASGYFHVQMVDDGLSISAHASHSRHDGLVVLPRVTNAIRVRMGR